MVSEPRKLKTIMNYAQMTKTINDLHNGYIMSSGHWQDETLLYPYSIVTVPRCRVVDCRLVVISPMQVYLHLLYDIT